MNPIFLGLDEVLALHARSIVAFGGTAGIRDVGLLESALAMPRATFGEAWLHTTLFEMAAAYLFHLCKNHPFLDGNKRVGLAAAILFLGLNGYQLDAAPDDLLEMVMAVAEGRSGKAEAATFFRENTTARSHW